MCKGRLGRANVKLENELGRAVPRTPQFFTTYYASFAFLVFLYMYGAVHLSPSSLILIQPFARRVYSWGNRLDFPRCDTSF